MKPPHGALFDRRLLIVAGKGGVGKTTIACALALVAARLGKRTLLTEIDGAGRAAALLGMPAGEIGQPQPVTDRLSVMSVEGSAALAEYLGIIMPVKRVLQAVLASRIYQYFVAAAPGLKELMTIGKIWYEAERTDEASGERAWDLVVMDAPATGHSLQYLGMPHAANEVFRSGLVGRESRRLLDLLTDKRRTAVNLVATAEEMPVNETVEMYERLHKDLHMPLGYLFVNRLHDAAFTAHQVEAARTAAAALADEREREIAAEALDRAQEEAGWTAINRVHLERLASEVKLPVVRVPFCFTEEFGTRDVRFIAEVIHDAIVCTDQSEAHHVRA